MPRNRSNVTPAQRELAQLQATDAAMYSRMGVGAGVRLGVAARRASLAAWRTGHDPTAAVLRELSKLRPLVIGGMVAARLKAIQRSRRTAPFTIRLATPVSDTFTASVSLLRRLLDISRPDLERLVRTFDAPVLRVMSNVSAQVERRLRQVTGELHARGAHVQEGVKVLAKEFDALGLVPENSFTVETIFRTQTALAYAAGKADVESSSDVQEILWGYKYVTVGDDRVRPQHAALEGVTLDKADPFWERFYPPNGYNCRCQVIPLFEAEEIKRPPDTVKLPGGAREPVAPDPGFGFNPGRVYGALTTIGVPAGSVL